MKKMIVWVTFIVSLLLLGGCKGDDESANIDMELLYGAWQVEKIGGTNVLSETTLIFTTANEVQLTYQVDGKTLSKFYKFRIQEGNRLQVYNDDFEQLYFQILKLEQNLLKFNEEEIGRAHV